MTHCKITLVSYIVLQLRSALLTWYDRNHRILPWRRNPQSQLSEKAVAEAAAQGHHPAPEDLDDNSFTYYVWVCEVMSQQTQVSRAAEYFRTWVKKWPDVQSLAAATQEEVNEAWAGLGYYRRARYLLDGAKYVVNELGGTFPKTSRELQKIPGVGPYTAAAIASIACGEASAVVDGNVIRVLARLRCISGDTRSSMMTKLFADLATQALDPERPGCFNQAVMELGATICVPNAVPSCRVCPIKQWCRAFESQTASEAGKGPRVSVTDYPSKVEKAERREETVSIAVVQVVASKDLAKDSFAGRFLLLKRPLGGLLAGLWEFPLAPTSKDAKRGEHEASIDKLLTETLPKFSMAWRSRSVSEGSKEDECIPPEASLKVLHREPLGQLVHIFSHIRMTMNVEKIVAQGEIAPNSNGEISEGQQDVKEQIQWLSAEELGIKGLSSGVKKVWKLYSDKAKRSKVAATQGIHRFFKPVQRS